MLVTIEVKHYQKMMAEVYRFIRLQHPSLTDLAICEMLGVSRWTLKRWCKELDLEVSYKDQIKLPSLAQKTAKDYYKEVQKNPNIREPELADKWGVSKETLRKWRKMHGIPKRSRIETQVTIEQIREWNKQGMKDTEISEMLGKNKSYIGLLKNRWRKQGIDI